MNLDPEEIQAWKNDHADRLQEIAEAKAKVDYEIPDFLVCGYGKDGGLARFNNKLTSDELFKLAKLIGNLADAYKDKERTEFQMRKNGITIV